MAKILVAVVLLVSGGASSLGTVNAANQIPLTADAYVASDSPDTNFGQSLRERIKGSSPARESYLKFEVPSNTSGTATLNLFINFSIATGVAAFATTNNWEEHAITFSNVPARGQEIMQSSGPLV